MAYCTQADIENQLDEDVLVQLTDDDDLGVVDTGVVTQAIAAADADIDSYCQGRYTVPLSPVPEKVLNLSVDLAIYNLYSRRDSFGMPNIRAERYKSAIRFLERVADGKIDLGAGGPTPSTSGNEVQMSSNTRIFTRSEMDGF